MKFAKYILGIMVIAIAILFLINSSNAQSNPSLFVIIQKSENCIVCNGNSERWSKDIIPHYSNGEVLFLYNDLTDENTRVMSKTQLDSYGLYDAISIKLIPGRVHVIDARTKSVITEFGIDESTENVLKTLNGSPNLFPDSR